jgi:putative transposase
LPLIRAIVGRRASYGYRRVTALLNRHLEAEGRAGVDHKRIYRIMRLGHLLQPLWWQARLHPRSRGGHAQGESTLVFRRVYYPLLEWRSGPGLFSLDCCDREATGWLATSDGVPGEMVRDLMSETIEHRLIPPADPIRPKRCCSSDSVSDCPNVSDPRH